MSLNLVLQAPGTLNLNLNFLKLRLCSVQYPIRGSRISTFYRVKTPPSLAPLYGGYISTTRMYTRVFPEMKAGEWLYLCVAHGNDGAMDVYFVHITSTIELTSCFPLGSINSRHEAMEMLQRRSYAMKKVNL